MSKFIEAQYFAPISTFLVPDYLLSPDENEEADGYTVGSWYVRWDELFYINKEGKEVQAPIIHSAVEDAENNCERFKRPKRVEVYAREEYWDSGDYSDRIEEHIEENGSW